MMFGSLFSEKVLSLAIKAKMKLVAQT